MLLVFAGCKPALSSKEAAVSAADEKEGFDQHKLPVIPASANGNGDRLVYLTSYYWRMMNVVDKKGNLNKETVEQNLVNYIGLLSALPADQGSQGIDLLMDQAVNNPLLFRHFISLFEKYLYEADSPLKNEELYIAVLEYVVKSPKIDAVIKSRPEYQLKMLYKNRLGHVAEDFVYLKTDGMKGNLFSLKSRFTLVLFYDPDCDYCKAAISQLKHSKLLNDMQNDKELQIMAVYTESNSKLWLNYVPSMPENWLNVSDQQQIKLHKKYDLKALPSLYLLDNKKQVLLKDATAEDVEDYLYHI